MNSNTKAILASLIIFLVIFSILFFFLKTVLLKGNGPLPGVISAVVAAVFSPRRKIIEKQTGKEVQLIWFFSDKVIRF